jgi:hypothetical protein
MPTGMYTKIPLFSTERMEFCHKIMIPSGSEILGVDTESDRAGTSIYLPVFIPDKDAELELRHFHVIQLMFEFETENVYFIGAGIIQKGNLKIDFAVIEILDTDIETQHTEENIPAVELGIEDYQKLFNSSNIKITRRDEE